MANHTNEPVVSAAGNGVIFASAVRAETGGVASDGVYDSDEFFNTDHRGVRLYINRTVATGTLTISIQGKNPLTDTWVALTGFTTPALTSAIHTTLTIYPGIVTVAGTGTTSTEFNGILPNVWRVHAVVLTNTTTWSMGGEYLA